jgi:uncharacterized protein YjiS (DUF1127 family)
MSLELILMPRDCIDARWRLPIHPQSAPSPLAAWVRQMAGMLRHLGDWRERVRGRHLLQQLDDRALRDVGLSRADVARECAKHFWQR